MKKIVGRALLTAAIVFLAFFLYAGIRGEIFYRKSEYAKEIQTAKVQFRNLWLKSDSEFVSDKKIDIVLGRRNVTIDEMRDNLNYEGHRVIILEPRWDKTNSEYETPDPIVFFLW